MNKKILKAALAATAVLALAAGGGGTWSSWSDWDTVTGSQVGADQLKLTVNESATSQFNDMKLAPGLRIDTEYVVANRTGTTIPLADLTMQLTNLVGHEDGCTSTSSEFAVDPDCNDTATPGEFIDEAMLIVNTTTPSTNPDACSLPHGNVQGPISLVDFRDQTASTPLAVGSLAPGQYVCVAMGLSMPITATNASQGDSASFDLKFMLNQHVS